MDATRLRFDFSHFAGVAEEELREVESIVNRQVLANTAVQTMVDVPIDVAVNELGRWRCSARSMATGCAW